MTETLPDAANDRLFGLDRLGADRLLTLLGGVCAIGFGTLALVLHLAGEGNAFSRGLSGFTATGGAVFTFVLTLAFGLLLLLAFQTMAARPAEGAILGLAFSVVLLAFGATAGVIAGLLGLVGSLVGVVRNLRFAA